tara:strand:+ start:1778 stop:2974 length:1197 start_codon:yes stop_codon:yes gene_type:complete
MWKIALGISVVFTSPILPVLAGQEPVMRILVHNSNEIRIRADKTIPIFVRGISSREIKVSSLNLKIKNNQIIWSVNNNSDKWLYLPLSSSIRVWSPDSRGIWLGKRRYRGEIRIFKEDQRLIAVNHLGIEKYLGSVVGSEMPKDWPMAALKAQAVAARTYALKRIGKKGLFDINSSESSQVYLGVEAETKRTREAVERTRSLVIRHKGKLISAVFHSSSGGQTEASGLVWKYQLPYLVSVFDYDQHNPKFRWRKKIFPTELRQVFFEIGGLNNIQVLKTSKTGRILTTKAYGPRGQLMINGKDLRKRLGLKSTLAKLEMVPYSTLSKSLNESSSNLSKQKKALLVPTSPLNYFLLIKGRGAGHGVGMSQWGANGLAQKGANFRQILHHYYSGVKIRPY